jgi:hypothetical protein
LGRSRGARAYNVEGWSSFYYGHEPEMPKALIKTAWVQSPRLLPEAHFIGTVIEALCIIKMFQEQASCPWQEKSKLKSVGTCDVSAYTLTSQ